MKKNILVSIVFIMLVFFYTKAADAELSIQEIINKANAASYYAGDDGKAEVSMAITDKQGRTRNRKFIILRKDVTDGGQQKYYVYFKEPGDVRDMVYMVWKHLDKDDDRWLYLPALDLVRRVSAGDKRSSFVGSNFLYEDVSGRSIELDEHELTENGDDFYKIKNTPKDSQGVDFKYYYIWIDKTNFLPKKAEYYNEQDILYRIVEAQEIKDIEGHPTVTRSKASDLDSGSNTVLEFKKVQYDIGITDDIFTERYLRRPPLHLLE